VGAEPFENKNQTKESRRRYIIGDNLNSVQDENTLNDPPETNTSESDDHASNNEGEGLNDPVLTMGRRLLEVKLEHVEFFPEEIAKFRSWKHISMVLDYLIYAYKDLFMKTSGYAKDLAMKEPAYDSLKETNATLTQELNECKNEIAY
jgi:hypothetical protein